jgi:N-acetylmuramoyl-L-alanine amidase
MTTLCFAEPILPLNDIQVRSVDANTTDVKLIFADAPTVHYFMLDHPTRLVVDIDNGRLQIPIHPSAFNGTLINSLRQGTQPHQVLRLVFDLNSDVNASESKADSKTVIFELKNKTPKMQQPVVTTNNMNKISDTLYPVPAVTSNKNAHATQISDNPYPVTAATTNKNAHATVVKTAPQGMRKVVVVIDAGHGGKDPGASGPRGSKEKNVVLGISQDLYQDINATPGMRAVMTRSGDYYLTLRQRLQKARAAKADVFIAVHADAYQNAQSHGASVYALSLKGASSEAARWLAAKENYSELGGVDLSDKNDMLRSVLIDLSQTATISSSLKLGDDILAQMGLFTPLHHVGVEQARFVVLKSPDIPSVLVETGFLSNSNEELKLRDAQYQQKVARAILKGVIAYFYQQPPEGTWISAQVKAQKRES